ncbi:MAG: NUDIX hydrolase [Bacillota bacterium]|jgi:ADP-ribose pyrophosphatase|nr:NUDIX hydrolase [Eubacteriales bacterium]MDI9492833.1 NUDIX hydrolase [Bacillota bacterium]NLV70163.1 NUDIX hydrolase [Clostridiales bacterium]HRV33412.1 NUDIX hydrolase [Anaerovoracaceae bacterium]MDD3537101.1 NUDIX hydrolase [Eubacteriales bacterium]
MTVEEKTIESEILFEGPVFKVRRHLVTAKEGRTARRDIVEHSGGVGICALTPDDKLVMIRQYRKAAECVVWEIPAGKAENGEDPVTTAKRELKEETGYEAVDFKRIARFYGTIGYNNEVIEIFRAETTIKGDTDFDENEAIDLFEIDLPTLLHMVDRGEIVDAKTIIGILMTARELGV